jgi:hypothetical protein
MHQLADRVTDLAVLPTVFDALDQSLGQSKPPIGRLQQDRPTIRTAVPLVELRQQRLAA